MKYCSQCGTQLPNEAKFCENCGARLQVSDQTDNRQSKSSKKTLGQKMMDNFHTNMELQKERRKKFKWWYWVIIAVALAYFMSACSTEEPNPYREAMEQYAKENIANPESYEFDYMGIEEEHKYVGELVDLRKRIEEEAKKPGADVEGYKKLDDLIQEAFDKVGYSIAYYQETLYFWYKGGQEGTMKLHGVVVARYDHERNLIMMTMRPDTLPTFSGLRMLKEKGFLNYPDNPEIILKDETH